MSAIRMTSSGWGRTRRTESFAWGGLPSRKRAGTRDSGYDVIVHFHGQTAMRMTLAQVARGVAFVGIDLGIASGAYSDAFASREAWPS